MASISSSYEHDTIGEIAGVQPIWEKDSARKTCNDCNLKFTIRRRRHHCRRCGRLFCKKCSGEKLKLEKYVSPFGIMENSKDEKLRVCDKCFTSIVKASVDNNFNTRARRRTATLEKAQKFLNSPSPGPVKFSSSGNSPSNLSVNISDDNDLSSSFASSTELLHDDSEDEAETQADYADSESNTNNQFKLTSREHSLTAIDGASNTSLIYNNNILNATKKTVKNISSQLLDWQKSNMRSNEIALESSIAALKSEIADLEKLIHGKQGIQDDAIRLNETISDTIETNEKKDKSTMHKETAANIQHFQVLNEQLMREQIEQKFPASMRWVLRMQPEKNLFLGIRDIDIESITAKFDIKGRKGGIRLHVYDVEAAISVYELKICGSTQTAKMLSNILSPTRIDLKVYGEWLMPLIFDKKAQAWTVSKKAIFKLKIKKSVGGVSAIKLPDKLISWLLNTFLPQVIKDAIISSLPIQIGDLVQDDITTIELSGCINIKNDLPISVWQAKLHKDTSLAKFARSKLGVTKDEAERLYRTTRHSAGRAAGFGTKVSMRGLHKFRLKYASCSDEDVALLLNTVEKVVNPTVQPTGWLNDIVSKADELALKSQTVNIDINDINILFDLYTFVHAIVEIEMEVLENDIRVQEERMLTEANTKSKRQGKLSEVSNEKESDAVLRARSNYEIAKSASKLTFTGVDVAISIIEKVSMDLKILIRGGTDGLALVSLDDLAISFHLLSFFEVIFPEQVVQFMHMAMTGANGPGKEEYKFSYFPIFGKTRIETPVELVLGHTKLEFLSGLLTGYSKRLCLQFGSELLNELLNQSNQMDAGKEVTKEKSSSEVSRKMEPAEGEDETALLKYLIPYFLNDDHDLLVQTYGVSLELARVDGYKLGMALKRARRRTPSANGETSEKQLKQNTMISFQITMSFTHLIKKL